MPYATREKKRVRDEQKRFVHYTTAESAVKIIRSQQFWMRNVRCMVDYSEVVHGRNCIESILSNETHREPLKRLLNECHSGIYEAVIERYLEQRDWIAAETYVGSLSEHSENEAHGRLSMWNSFGRSAPTAALVLNVSLDEAEGEGVGILFSPVGYLNDDEILEEFLSVIKNVEANKDYIKSIPYEYAFGYFLMMIIMAATCLKHEGFKEEREWRALHIPTLFDSPKIQKEIEYISGIPQIVSKLPLVNFPELGVSDLDLNSLLYKVIVGPTPYALPISTAIKVAMNEVGVIDSANKVVISGIPIRT